MSQVQDDEVWELIRPEEASDAPELQNLEPRISLEKQIRSFSPDAASALARAGIKDDIDIQELTRDDLNELLPGLEHFKLRKRISELLTKSKQDTAKPIDLILNEFRDFISAVVMKNALVPGGVLHGYVPILRDLEKQLAKALHFIQAHVELLESYNKEEPMEAEGNAVSPSVDSATAGNQLILHELQDIDNVHKKSVKGASERPALGAVETHPKRPRTDVPLTTGGQNRQNLKETPDETSKSYSYTSGSPYTSGAAGIEPSATSYKDGSIQAQKEKEGKEPGSWWTFSNPFIGSGLGGNETKHLPVKVHSQVCGKTLNTHLALMKQVDNLGLKREETSAEDCQVMMVFCPVTSRVGTDIEAAMSQVPGNRDAILVVMHHTYDQNFVTSRRSVSYPENIVEEVNVLFLDSVGLLHCKTNDEAVTLIHKALQKYNSST